MNDKIRHTLIQNMPGNWPKEFAEWMSKLKPELLFPIIYYCKTGKILNK